MKSPENSVRRPPALVENPGFYAVVLCCSVLFCAVVFVSTRKAVRYCVNVAKPRLKRQKSLEPAKEKTEQQCLIINKKNHLKRFIPFTSSVDFWKCNSNFQLDWSTPEGGSIVHGLYSFYFYLRELIFADGWKNRKNLNPHKFGATLYSKLNYWIMQF